MRNMWIENAHKYFNIEQDEYFKMQGVSYSFIKNEGQQLKPTVKMRFGSLVDQYLFEPHKYDGTLFELVRPVAVEVNRYLKGIKGKPQVAVTADFCHEGMKMPYKGRIDLLTDRLVIDLKCSELDIERSINLFGYDKQVSGYSYAAEREQALIISIHPRTKKIQSAIINPEKSRSWWEDQILSRGEKI